jgi:hypothetical protein
MMCGSATTQCFLKPEFGLNASRIGGPQPRSILHERIIHTPSVRSFRARPRDRGAVAGRAARRSAAAADAHPPDPRAGGRQAGGAIGVAAPGVGRALAGVGGRAPPGDPSHPGGAGRFGVVPTLRGDPSPAGYRFIAAVHEGVPTAPTADRRSHRGFIASARRRRSAWRGCSRWSMRTASRRRCSPMGDRVWRPSSGTAPGWGWRTAARWSRPAPASSGRREPAHHACGIGRGSRRLYYGAPFLRALPVSGEAR